MGETGLPGAQAQRLEQLWSGRFGDDYVSRNRGSYGRRGAFWSELLAGLDCRRVLEVGCNVGGNLGWIAAHSPGAAIVGLDINPTALAQLRSDQSEVAAVLSQARDLPLRDHTFDFVFTMGVLIHQPDESLPAVMAEMVRCSRRWVLAAEYFAPGTVEVPYRGVEGALFKRDYGALFAQGFPELTLRRTGFLGQDDGWDDVTWWLFERL